MKLSALFLLTVTAMSSAEEINNENLFSQANSHLTNNFFNAAVKTAPAKNTVMSAYSLMVPLNLLALASEGQTQSEILRATGFPSIEAVKSVYPSVNDKLRNIKGVTFTEANRIYIRKDAKLNPNFADTSKKLFRTEVKNVDFEKNNEVAREINEWVEGQTNNRIKDLVTPNDFNGATRAALINAIYFKGNWKYQFSTKKTEEADFRVGGKTKKVSMMNIENRFNYANVPELDAQILELPYDGDEASFVVVLPNKDDGLAALEEKLKDVNALPNALKQMRNQKVDVYLPKFKIESTWELKEILKSMGVKRLFEAGKADLKNLLVGDENLVIDKALQKAFLEVSEEGVEAAAANTIYVIRRMGMTLPVKFVADRPFFFAIQERDNIVFSGVLSS